MIVSGHTDIYIYMIVSGHTDIYICDSERSYRHIYM
jgi:hypothetical protein